MALDKAWISLKNAASLRCRLDTHAYVVEDDPKDTSLALEMISGCLPDAAGVRAAAVGAAAKSLPTPAAALLASEVRKNLRRVQSSMAAPVAAMLYRLLLRRVTIAAVVRGGKIANAKYDANSSGSGRRDDGYLESAKATYAPRPIMPRPEATR